MVEEERRFISRAADGWPKAMRVLRGRFHGPLVYDIVVAVIAARKRTRNENKKKL